MNRGIFGSIIDNETYTDSKKDWYVELSRADIYWYDLVVNPPAELDTRKIIVDQLKSLKKSVEESLEKRFIYFICSRVKVRFDILKKHKYGLLDGKFYFHLLVGREKKRMAVNTVFRDAKTGSVIRPKIEISEKFISITDKYGNSITMTVHDFLMASNIDVGYPTLVQYVGYTKNPDIRPTNGVHGGLSEVIYKLSNEENDIFIIFNLFKVIVNAVNSSRMMNFIIPNSMTDEIKTDLEGQILEKCLIFYFDSSNQTKNKKKEKLELIGNLNKIATNNKINSIQFHYEVDGDSEYWRLGSSNVEPNHRHLFSIEMINGKMNIKNGSQINAETYGEQLL